MSSVDSGGVSDWFANQGGWYLPVDLQPNSFARIDRWRRQGDASGNLAISKPPSHDNSSQDDGQNASSDSPHSCTAEAFFEGRLFLVNGHLKREMVKGVVFL